MRIHFCVAVCEDASNTLFMNWTHRHHHHRERFRIMNNVSVIEFIKILKFINGEANGKRSRHLRVPSLTNRYKYVICGAIICTYRDEQLVAPRSRANQNHTTITILFGIDVAPVLLDSVLGTPPRLFISFVGISWRREFAANKKV